MASDVERIASIIGNNYSSEPEFDYRDYLPAAEALVENGFGHIPTALHQAADALDEQADAYFARQRQVSEGDASRLGGLGDGSALAARFIRARADRAGGTA